MARRTVQPQDLLRLPRTDRRSHGCPGVPRMRGARHASACGLEKGSRAERRTARQRGVPQLGPRDASAVCGRWLAGLGRPRRPAAPPRAQHTAARGRAQRPRGRPTELRRKRGRRTRGHGPHEPRRCAVGRPQGGARCRRHRPPCGDDHSRLRRRDGSSGHRRRLRPKAPPRTCGQAGHQRAARYDRPERTRAPAAAAGRRRLRQRRKQVHP